MRIVYFTCDSRLTGCSRGAIGAFSHTIWIAAVSAASLTCPTKVGLKVAKEPIYMFLGSLGAIHFSGWRNFFPWVLRSFFKKERKDSERKKKKKKKKKKRKKTNGKKTNGFLTNGRKRANKKKVIKFCNK